VTLCFQELSKNVQQESNIFVIIIIITIILMFLYYFPGIDETKSQWLREKRHRCGLHSYINRLSLCLLNQMLQQSDAWVSTEI